MESSCLQAETICDVVFVSNCCDKRSIPSDMTAQGLSNRPIEGMLLVYNDIDSVAALVVLLLSPPMPIVMPNRRSSPIPSI